MDLEIMEQVLKEILQQQKDITADNEKDNEARQQVFAKLETFEKKLDTLKIPANETSAVLIPVKKWIEEVKTLIAAQPKTVVHERRFQLFANRTEEFYKFIFGTLFKGIVILIIVVYGLVVLNRYIREREYLHYKQAWQYLYIHQKEDYKIFLDSTWNNSQKGSSVIRTIHNNRVDLMTKEK